MLLPWLWLTVFSCFIKPMYPFMFLFVAIMTATLFSRYLNANRSVFKFNLHPSFLNRLKLIGIASYSIYLLQEPLLRSFSRLIQNYAPALILLLLVIFWMPLILLSLIWYKIFELPGIAFGKRMIQKLGANPPILRSVSVQANAE